MFISVSVCGQLIDWTTCFETSRRIHRHGFTRWWVEQDSEWQAGYLGVFVSPSQIEPVRKYVLNQEEHHRRKTFQEEYLDMLKLSGIEYDRRYVW